MELSTVIPTNPSVVVDELRVLATPASGSSNISRIDYMNIGMPIASTAEEPFQSQTLKNGGEGSTFVFWKPVYVGRDFTSDNKRILANQLNIGENGSVFSSGTTFPRVEAGTFRAKEITGPSSAVVMEVKTSLSGRDIDVDTAKIASPFDKGRKIVKHEVNTKMLATEDTETSAKRHIYYPCTMRCIIPSGIPENAPITALVNVQ